MLPSKGGPVSVPGSISYTTPGTYNFVIPLYTTLTVDVRGAGGGGGGLYGHAWDYEDQYFGTDGGPGGVSQFQASTYVQGNGGGGGHQGEYIYDDVGSHVGSNGTNGTASGGDTNTTGGGSAGGSGSTDSIFNNSHGGTGGYGGRAVKEFAIGNLTVGNTYVVVVGTGGIKGTETFSGSHRGDGYPGSNGAVYISWT
jgi:hypothetical protein